MLNDVMVRTQIQLPDALYDEAKRVAREREMSLAEVVRRGVEYITQVYAPVTGGEPWSPPAASDLGPFQAREKDWRLIDPAAAGSEPGV